MARYENENEEYLRSLYDTFYSDNKSILRGMLSPAKKEKNKISRVTFNAAMKTILSQIINNQPEAVYPILNNYLFAFINVLPSQNNPKLLLTNSTLFTSIILLFPKASIKVQDKFKGDYSIDNFFDVIKPLVNVIKPNTFTKPGSSYRKLYDSFSNALDNVDLTF